MTAMMLLATEMLAAMKSDDGDGDGGSNRR